MTAEQTGGPVDVERCSQCGRTEKNTYDLAWEGFTDVRVIVRDGEEGFADITQLLCAEHHNEVIEGLLALGFKDHRHGSIDFLEDEDCPGAHRMDDCPTPTEYGRVTVLPPSQSGRGETP